MTEKRRLRNVEVEVAAWSGGKGEWLVWHTIPGIGRGEGWVLDAQELAALTEPIPEEEESPTKGFEAVRPPDLLARIERLEELEEEHRVLRLRVGEQENRHDVLVDRVVALEEREVDHGDKIGQLMSGAGLARSVPTVRSPTPASEGPSAEDWVGWTPMRSLAEEMRDAIHMIRAHEKPELTEEIVERAAMAAYEIDGASWNKASKYERQDCISDMEAALRSTEMFR